MSKKIRVAIVDPEACKPTKCNKECIKYCPPTQQGKKCIEIEAIKVPESKNIIITDKSENNGKKVAKIREDLCISCGLCVKKCPFNAITIVNIPQEIKGNIVHRFGENGFRLYKLPTLEHESIMGLIGCNGVGKTVTVKILSNKLKPNFEQFEHELTDKEIIKMFRGNVTQKYLELLYKNKLRVIAKPQHVEQTAIMLKKRKEDPTVKEFISKNIDCKFEDSQVTELLRDLDMYNLIDYKVVTLSGGELQRLIIIICLLKDADVYIFDEPSNFLDVRQRLNVARQIRKLIKSNRYIIAIEHDMAMLDYMADTISILYGVPGAYGVVSMPSGTAEAINNYFDGYIPSENMRFRKEEYNLKSLNEITEVVLTENNSTKYTSGTIKYDKFQLDIKSGQFKNYACLNLIIGPNGAGKTTYINYLKDSMGYTVSFKPQYLNFDKYIKKDSTYPTVEELLYTMIRSKYINETFKSEVVKPLDISKILDREVDKLSGGEAQKVHIIMCLGSDAQIYMLDEPSANLDIEQRVNMTKVIKRFIMNNSKVGFIVDHDMMVITSLAQEPNSQIINLEITEIKDNMRYSVAHEPCGYLEGINKFLKMMDVTMRVEKVYNRPRINKADSQKEAEQKKLGKYYM